MALALTESFSNDERMEIDNKSKSDLEDGELSDPQEFPCRVYENHRKDVFVTGVDIFSSQTQEKLDERAKRFNIDPNNTAALTDEQITELYRSLGVTEQDTRNIRFDAVHVRGTEEMSTEEVFQYFKLYGPATIEWINDYSCNVVWLDRSSAARALKGMSRAIRGLKREKTDDGVKIPEDDDVVMLEEEFDDNSIKQNDINDNSVDISTIDTPIPPGFWRLGQSTPKAKHILLRYATIKDKKPLNAEKMSGYYKKYGNPNFGGLRGIITDRKRKIIRNGEDKDSIDLDGGKKNPWGDLSKMWALSESPKRVNPTISKALKDRIGVKREMSKPLSNSEYSDSDNSDDFRKRVKIPRMKMYADEEELRVQRSRQRRNLLQDQKQNDISNDNYSSDEDYQQSIPVKKANVKSRLGNYVRNDEYCNGRLGSPSSGESDDESYATGAYGSVINVIRPQSPVKPTLASTISRSTIERRRNNTSESSEGSENEGYNKEDSRESTRRKSFSRPGFDKADLRSRLSNKSIYKNKAPGLKVEIDNDYYSDN